MSTEKHISDILPEIEARARRAWDAHSPFRHPLASTGEVRTCNPSETNGFPLRSIMALGNFKGAAAAIAKNLLPLMMKDGTLLIYGPTGRGKTVMATWFEQQRLIAGKKAGMFLDARDIFARMKQCWAKGEDSEAITKKWRETPYLVIDEMQSRSETAWENNELDHLVNKRYSAMLPTVMLANFATEKEAQESLGARIIDRVRETGHLVPCDWPSYRQ
jgi:DNA replication protein DnaC